MQGPPQKTAPLAGQFLRLALVALAYWIAARLSLNLALVHGQVTPIWPPTGIALVAILVMGRRVWPAIFVGALAVNLPIGPSPLGAAVIAAGNSLAPLISAELLRRTGFQLEMDRLRDALALIVVAALMGMTPVSAAPCSLSQGRLRLLTSGPHGPSGGLVTRWACYWSRRSF